MGRAEFVQELKTLVNDVQEMPDGRVVFPYLVQTGKFAGKQLRIGFEIPQDFPAIPPSGPHISPHILPLQSGGSHPSGGIHASSSFGPEWQYWSRPIKGVWDQTDRSVKVILAHLRHLFDTQGE